MAAYQAIAAVSTALRALLADSVTPEIAGAGVQVLNAGGFEAPMTEGIVLYLYRAAVNTALRPALPRSDPRSHPSLALDLHYLVAAFATDAIRQQVLLGWAGRVLEGSALLSAAVLNQHAPGAGAFRADETVELIPETLSLQDEASIWTAARARQQISLCYMARVVRIDAV